MNLDEYRAVKAQQEADEQLQTQGGTVDAQIDNGTTITPVQTQEETTQASTGVPVQSTESTPQVVEVDGKEIPIDELKNGYLRQSDYTQKTQQIAVEKAQLEIANQYYKALQSDPEEAKLFAEKNNLPFLSPQEQELTQIKQQYEDMLVQQEVELMKTKYQDFNDTEVVKFAVEKNMSSLEDAYLLMKAKTGGDNTQANDIKAMEERIRQELLQEIQSSKSTGSIIGTQGQSRQVVDETPQLSESERKVARGLKMTEKDYATWRDAK